MFSSGSVNWRITGAYSTPPRVKRDEKGKVKRKKKKKKREKTLPLYVLLDVLLLK